MRKFFGWLIVLILVCVLFFVMFYAGIIEGMDVRTSFIFTLKVFGAALATFGFIGLTFLAEHLITSKPNKKKI